MSGDGFNSLLHAANHFAELAKHFVEHEVGHSGGGSAGGGGKDVEREILREGAAIIEREVKRGLAGANVYGLAALSPSTVAKKGSAEFLRETGALAGSVSMSVGEHDAHVGSNDDKITFLELGTSKMPPRPVFQRAGMVAEPLVQAMAMRKVVSILRQ